MVVVAVEKVIGGIYTCVLISSRVWDTRAIMSRHVVLYATVRVCVAWKYEMPQQQQLDNIAYALFLLQCFFSHFHFTRQWNMA